MKKIILAVCLSFLLAGCNKTKEPLIIEPTAENFARYIVEAYNFGDSGEFIERYLDGTYSTNLFLINLLSDSYDEISIISFNETGALLDCDGTAVRMNITISDGIISKIQLTEGSHD